MAQHDRVCKRERESEKKKGLRNVLFFLNICKLNILRRAFKFCIEMFLRMSRAETASDITSVLV